MFTTVVYVLTSSEEVKAVGFTIFFDGNVLTTGKLPIQAACDLTSNLEAVIFVMFYAVLLVI